MKIIIKDSFKDNLVELIKDYDDPAIVIYSEEYKD